MDKKTEILNKIKEAKEETVKDLKNIDATLNLAAIGGKYKIGPIDMHIAMGNWVLLNAIDSPFVTGAIKEGDAIPEADCKKFFYVLGEGKEALKPIMAIKQRISVLKYLEPMAKNNPILCREIVDRAEEIGSAESIFEQNANDYFNEHFLDTNYVKVFQDIFVMLRDFDLIKQDLDYSDEPEDKKKV